MPCATSPTCLTCGNGHLWLGTTRSSGLSCLEVRNLMSTHDLLLAYLRGLKQDVQRHVMLRNPTDVGHAMTLADSADSAMWFSGSW